MRKLLTFALASLAATALAGSAVAAAQPARTMKVPLADGSTVTIRYVGDVAPTVTILPAAGSPRWLSQWMFPNAAYFDRLFAEMNRRQAEMMRHVRSLPRQPVVGGPGVNLAAAGNMPEGASSVSVVSVTSGGKTCTRTTEVVAQGAGKPPKVTTNASGECGSGPAAVGPAPPTV